MNNETVATLIALLVGDLLVLAVLLWMPVMRREKAFFGVRVSREIYEGEGRRILRRYWLCLLAAFVALSAFGFLTAYYRNNFLYAAVSYALSVPLAFVLYTNFAREVRPFRIVSEGKRFASSLRTRRLADYTTIALEALVVIVTIAPVFALVYYYPGLPERVPVHWGLNGEPDRWAHKTFATVFFIPVLAAYLQSWFVLLKYDIVHAKMTLPAEQAEVYMHYKEMLLAASVRMIDWMRGIISLLLANVSLFILLTTVESWRGWMPFASTALWVNLALLLSIAFYFLYRFMAINNQLEEATGGDANVRRQSEEEKWSGGGTIYYNPDDPALIVEKMDGLGYTYNFAGKGIRLRLMFLAGVPLLVLWALLDL
jgi:uncharacterized membrane protein